MPRARALDVTRKLKAALIAGSVMALGVLTALAAGHVTGVTAQAANGSNVSNGSNSSSSNSSSSSNIPSNTNRGDDGGFFNQAPSNSSGAQGGFGVSPSAPYQQPASGTTVS